MRPFRDWTIKARLSAAMMITSTAAVLLVGAVLIAFSVYRWRWEQVRDLRAVAHVLARNCQAALMFDMPEDAETVLAALAVDESVVLACVYDRNGAPFALYRSVNAPPGLSPPGVQPQGHTFQGRYVSIFHVIELEGQVLGTLFVQDDRTEEKAMFQRDTAIWIFGMALALGAAFLVAQALQRVISKPILALAHIADTVGRERDYSIRAKKRGRDEIGRLMASFNDMLAQIQAAQEALRQSEERYRTLVENIDLGITLVDAEHNVLMVNAAVGRMFGVDPQSLIGTKCYVKFEKRDHICAHCPGEKAFRQRKPADVETHGVRDDGSRFPVRIRAFPLFDESGKPTSYVEVVQDLTEQREAEKVLRETEERFRDFFQQAPVGFHIFGPDRRFIDINEAELKMIGYARDEIVGRKTWADLIVAEQQDVFEKHWADLLSRGRVQNAEYTVVHKDGHRVHVIVNASALFDEAGRLVRTRGSVLDITERRQMLSRLRESQAMLQNVLDTINVRVFWKDKDLRFRGCNRLFARDAGLSDPAEIVGKTDFDLPWKVLAPSYRRDDQQIIESGESKLTYEEPLTTPQGKSIWLNISKIPMRNENGEIIGILGTYEDVTDRKRAELAVRLSEQRFRAIANYSYDWELWISPQGSVLWTNPAVERITGYSVDEFMGLTAYPDAVVYEEDRSAVAEAFQSALQGGSGKQLEFRIRRKDERILWVTMSWQPIFDNKGVSQGHRESIEDVSERKKAETDLEESRERFRGLVESTSDSIWEIDHDNKYTYVSPKVTDLLGYEPQQILGKTPFDLMPPDEAGRVARIFHEARDACAPLRGLENVNRHKDGHHVILETSGVPIFDACGNLRGYRGIDRDITKRKRTENAMRAIVEGTARATGEDFLRRLVRHLATAISCRYVLLGQIIGPRMDRVRTLAVWAGTDYGDNFEYDLEGTPCQNVTAGQVWVYPAGARNLFPQFALFQDVKAEGYLGIPLVDSGGRPLGLLAAVSDKPLEAVESAESVMSVFATRAAVELERKQAEEERERLLHMLEQKNRELESIVYTSSHDLRSTVVNVQGFSAELSGTCTNLLKLVEELPVPHEKLQRELLTMLHEDIPTELNYITASAARMDVLITGLLKLSRLGRVRLNVQPVDMNDLMRKLVGNRQEQIQEAQARVHVDSLPMCIADPEQLTQVFGHLLDNAVKYRHPARAPVISISAHTSGQMSVYCVADNGPGIAPRHQKNIFEVFHRLEPEGPVAGEGLGLSIVRRIVDRHGGRVWVESVPGEGSRFFVSLPSL